MIGQYLFSSVFGMTQINGTKHHWVYIIAFVSYISKYQWRYHC